MADDGLRLVDHDDRFARGAQQAAADRPSNKPLLALVMCGGGGMAVMTGAS